MKQQYRFAISTTAMILSLACLGANSAAAQPKTLEDCYLNVAMTKSTADMVYLAREICDAAFNRFPRSLTVLTPKSKNCDEWWFDQNGRSENADRYCSLAESGTKTWKLACRWKSSNPDAYSFVELRERNGRMEPVSEARGKKMGDLFSNLAACVEHKLGPAKRAETSD
jgi:hypothetical protein